MEGDVAAGVGNSGGVRAVHRFRIGLNDIEDAPQHHADALHVGEDIAELHRRVEHEARADIQLHDKAGRAEDARAIILHAPVKQQADRAGAHHVGEDGQPVLLAHQVHHQPGEVMRGLGEGAHLGELAPEDLDGAHGGDALLHAAVESGGGAARGDIAFLDMRADAAENEDVARQRNEHQDAEFRVDDENDRRPNQDAGGLLHEVDGHRADARLNGAHVIQHHGKQAAGLGAVEERERQPLHLLVQHLAQFEDHALPDIGNLEAVDP
ncbi:MAG: hypothetical protein BWY76_02833 [bacterium ADurb.Bin429]|nr:MAG: hypothetical protein BWY76_02833 [bacterium ADurb.Bin429]